MKDYETMRLTVSDAEGFFRLVTECEDEGCLLLGYDDWCHEKKAWERKDEIRVPLDWAKAIARNLFRLEAFEAAQGGE
jgi:hypothetical protein